MWLILPANRDELFPTQTDAPGRMHYKPLRSNIRQILLYVPATIEGIKVVQAAVHDDIAPGQVLRVTGLCFSFSLPQKV